MTYHAISYTTYRPLAEVLGEDDCVHQEHAHELHEQRRGDHKELLLDYSILYYVITTINMIIIISI